MFRRCPRGEDGENGGGVGTPVMEDDRMGFIMFEAGLENMALRYGCRKGEMECLLLVFARLGMGVRVQG